MQCNCCRTGFVFVAWWWIICRAFNTASIIFCWFIPTFSVFYTTPSPMVYTTSVCVVFQHPDLPLLLPVYWLCFSNFHLKLHNIPRWFLNRVKRISWGAINTSRPLNARSRILGRSTPCSWGVASTSRCSSSFEVKFRLQDSTLKYFKFN